MASSRKQLSTGWEATWDLKKQNKQQNPPESLFMAPPVIPVHLWGSGKEALLQESTKNEWKAQGCSLLTPRRNCPETEVNNYH